MFGQRLLLPFGISLFIHFLVLLLLFEALPSASTRLPLVSPGIAFKLVAQSSFRNSGGVQKAWEPVSESVGAKSVVDSETVHAQGQSQFLPGVGVYEVGELDGGVALLSGPPIEPEYGFADDVLGVVNISVLVNPDGKAVMVWHAPSDLDPAAIMYMTNALRVAVFSPPRKRGFPVFGIFRMRVEVGSLLNGHER